jgi:hypothetical protein
MVAQQLNYSNFFETTLAAIVGSSDNNLTLTAAPTSNGSSAISPPFYLVIDPDNETNKEVVLVTVVKEMFEDLHDQLVSGTITFTNKTFDAEGTGNALSNVDVANLKSGVLDTDISSVSGSDDTLASAKAIKTYVDAQNAAQSSGASLGLVIALS